MSHNDVWLQKSYGEYFNIPPVNIPFINTHLVVEKPTDGAVKACEELIVPTIVHMKLWKIILKVFTMTKKMTSFQISSF
jgi:hypothetical protein